MEDLKEIYQKGREYNMWFAVLFLIILFGGAVTMLFMLYKWYQALGIILLCIIAPVLFNAIGKEFEWLSYILGYALCLISHTSININKD